MVHTIISTGAREVVKGLEILSHLAHSRQALLNFLDLLNVVQIRRLSKSTEEVLNGLVVVHPLVHKRSGWCLLGLHGHRLHRRLAAGSTLALRNIGLALSSLSGRLGRGNWGRTAGASMVVVNTLHMVPKVPLARESVSGNGTLTSLVNTKEGLISVAMESVCLTLMSQKASS